MTGETLNYKRRLEINVVKYFQMAEEETPHNRTKQRTRGAIGMSPSGNKQGVFKFMTLGSTKKVTSPIWDEIPMLDTIIYQVNALGQGQPNDLEFLDSKKFPIVELETWYSPRCPLRSHSLVCIEN